jgi:putative ATPase
VENGTVILIGATTQNPFFTINSPLLSRSTIFEFSPLSADDIVLLLRRALADRERGLGRHNVEASDDALRHLATVSDGDARRALTALEVGVLSQLRTHTGAGRPMPFDLDVAQESIQAKAVQYDRHGDLHYDAASAFIKSMRGSDPDAAVYWLAKMLVAGEDPRFIARRIAILASEDIGNADPRAICVAAAAFDVTEKIGLPECQLTLAQAAIYMACAPKSNASYRAIAAATDDVKNRRTVPVPRSLQNAPYPGMAEQLGRSKGYQYSHDYAGGVSPDQVYLGVDKQFYVPTDRGYEKHIAAYLEYVRRLRSSQQAAARPARPREAGTNSP